MTSLFDSLFKSRKTGPNTTLAAATLGDDPVTVMVNAPPDTALETVRMALGAMQRRLGIPRAWLGCDIAITRERGQPQVDIFLVVKHQDSRLFLHSREIGAALSDELVKLDPRVSAVVRTVSWRLSRQLALEPNVQLNTEYWDSPDPMNVARMARALQVEKSQASEAEKAVALANARAVAKQASRRAQTLNPAVARQDANFWFDDVADSVIKRSAAEQTAAEGDDILRNIGGQPSGKPKRDFAHTVPYFSATEPSKNS